MHNTNWVTAFEFQVVSFKIATNARKWRNKEGQRMLPVVERNANFNPRAKRIKSWFTSSNLHVCSLPSTRVHSKSKWSSYLANICLSVVIFSFLVDFLLYLYRETRSTYAGVVGMVKIKTNWKNSTRSNSRNFNCLRIFTLVSFKYQNFTETPVCRLSGGRVLERSTILLY